jgi:hypothetical protein
MLNSFYTNSYVDFTFVQYDQRLNLIHMSSVHCLFTCFKARGNMAFACLIFFPIQNGPLFWRFIFC